MKLSRVFSIVVSLLMFTASAHAVYLEGEERPTRPDFAPDRILVKFRQDSPPAAISEILKNHGVSVRKVIRGIGVVVLSVPRGLAVSEIVRKLNSEVAVEYAEHDYIARAMETLVPNDEKFSQQWALNNTGQTGGKTDADIDAPEGWSIQTGKASVRIAVVDTGISSLHEDLAGKVGAGYNAIDGSGNAEDDNGHGTHVSGIAAAQSNNVKGIAGVSWGCALMPVKVLNESGSGTYSDIAEGISWAADNGANVINMSLGGSFPSSTLEAAVNYAWNKGVLLACAAGNSGTSKQQYPGSYTNCIAVAATDSKDAKPQWSTYGSWVDVAAPGVSILSTYQGNSYASLSGTSMATPHVAGLAGLLFSVPLTDGNGNGRSNDEVRARIESTCDIIPMPRKKTYWTNGRINVFKALTQP